MSERAGGKALRSVGNNIVENAGDQRGRPIGSGVREGKSECHEGKGEPGESAKRNSVELFRDQVTQQKTAPENFFEQRDDHDEAEESERENRPIERRRTGKCIEIKSDDAIGKPEKLLWRDPDREYEERDDDREESASQRVELVFAAEKKQHRGARERLQRVDPKLGHGSPEWRAARPRQPGGAEKQGEKQDRRDVGKEPALIGRAGNSIWLHRDGE